MTSIPEIGEDGFLPKVLAYIRAQLGVEGSTDQSDTDDDDIATEPPQINASIFSSILLDRIVEGAGVILDVDVHGLTAHKSAQAIRGVSQHVETMMSGIFGLETRYLHLAARATPEELVASLISAKPGASSSTAAEIPQVLVLSGLERCRSGVWAKLVDISIKRYIEMEEWRVEQDHSTDTEPDTSRIPLPAGFTIIWVREESLADTIPSYLIDRFSLNEPIHPSDVVPLPILPVRALFPPLLLTNLTTLLPYMHIHPPLQIHISNLLSGITAHPRLHSSITGRAATLFPRLVQAHRLLSGPFYLPMGWQEGLERRRRIQAGEDVDAYTFYNGKDGRGGGDGGKGLSGGKGGVGMWDVFSGSEPSVLDLGRAVTGEVEEEEEEEDEPYTTPVNVEGVFWTGLRHRIRYREEMDEVMWFLKGTASDMLAGKGEASAKDGRRKGREVDRVLGKILQSV